MKEIKKSLAAVALAAICTIGLVACGSNKTQSLSTPQNLEVDDCEYLHWDAVEGASGYSVEINEKVYKTDENKLDIFLLTDRPINYNIRVKAEGGLEKTDSDWSDSISFDCDDGNLYSFNYVSSDTIASVQVWTRSSARGKIIIPAEFDGRTVTALGDPLEYDDHGGISQVYYDEVALARSFIMPDTVKYIGQTAFYNWPYLTRLKLSSSLTEIKDLLFCDCEKLSEIIIPDSVEKIGYDAFSGCTNLKKVVLSKSLKYLGSKAWGGCFRGCKSLESIYIPASVEVIGSGCFSQCSNLSVTIDENNKYYAVEGNAVIEKSSGKVITRFGV